MTILTSQASRVKLAIAQYDFDDDGGAQGTIVVGAGLIPSGAIILDGIIHVKTAVTSGGAATVAVEVNGSADVLAATGKASLTLNALIDTVCDGTAANAIRTTAEKGVSFVIATADLTAGVIAVCLRYVETV